MLVVLMAGLAGCLLASNAYAGLFRWVDDNGMIHYSDSVPPYASQSGHAELDQSGVTMKKVPAAKSKEQVQEEEWLAELEAKRRKSKEKQMREDSQLLSSYSDIGQFDSSHNARIDMIREGRKQLELLRDKLTAELEGLQKQLEQPDKANRERVQGFIGEKQKNIGEYTLAIQQNQQEETSMQADFEKQRARFLDLLKRKAEEEQAPAS